MSLDVVAQIRGIKAPRGKSEAASLRDLLRSEIRAGYVNLLAANGTTMELRHKAISAVTKGDGCHLQLSGGFADGQYGCHAVELPSIRTRSPP